VTPWALAIENHTTRRGGGGETAGNPWEKGPTAISPLQATRAGASSPAALRINSHAVATVADRRNQLMGGTKAGRLVAGRFASLGP
jgi:hypothetical protein